MANSNRVIVPAARAALDQFKMEAANEVGVNLKQGYNGDLTSKRGWQHRRPDGQEDDRSLRKWHEVIALLPKEQKKKRR